MTTEDLSTISFRNNPWLERNRNILTKETVLDYFSTSTFYDQTCNNEQCKMQQRPMQSMIGIEYVVVDLPNNNYDNNMFMIRKQFRQSPESATISAVYYVIAATIYQAPTANSVFTARVNASLHYLSEAFQLFMDHVCFEPNQGNYWDFQTPPNSQAGTAQELQIRKPERVKRLLSLLDLQKGRTNEGAPSDSVIISGNTKKRPSSSDQTTTTKRTKLV